MSMSKFVAQHRPAGHSGPVNTQVEASSRDQAYEAVRLKFPGTSFLGVYDAEIAATYLGHAWIG